MKKKEEVESGGKKHQKCFQNRLSGWKPYNSKKTLRYVGKKGYNILIAVLTKIKRHNTILIRILSTLI